MDAEMCALGAAMLSPDAAAGVLETLRADDFYRPGHQTIFRAIGVVADSGEPVNVFTVLAAAQRGRAGQEWVPDGPYLHTLIERPPVAFDVGWFAARVINAAKLRRLIQAGTRAIQEGYGTDPEDADQAVERATKVFDEATQSRSSSKSRSVAELIDPFLENLQPGREKRGVTTGWADLDACLQRLRPGQLITIAARTSVGKSVIMACLAHNVGVKLNLPVWVGTLEMDVEEYLARLVAADAGVELRSLLDPDLLTDADWQRLGRAHGRFTRAETLVLDDEGEIGPRYIRSALRSMRRSGAPARLAIVDYLQLMSAAERSESRQVEVAGFSRALKKLAKEFEVPVVIAAQLNREVERRQDKTPTISDIRESDAIAHDSDVVILLDRPDANDPLSPRAGEIDLIVAKNRNGPRTTITAAFQGRFSRVVDMAQEPEEPWSPTRMLRSM
jgi:replicative DNA helicase